VDTIWLEGIEPDVSAFISTDDLVRVGFPDDPTTVQLAHGKDFTLITDVEALDKAQLLAHINKVTARMRLDMPFLGPAVRPTMLIVFANRTAFEAFVQRFAQQMNSQGSVPNQGTGYSFLGVATSYWDETYGTQRPVFTHEFVHGYLSRCMALANTGEWFHEGLATLYQVTFHPQDDLAKIIRRGVNDRRFRSEPRLLCDGRKIPMDRYWQAMSIVQMLIQDSTYKARLPRLVRAFEASGSTSLAPHLETVLHKDWETFERDWRSFCDTAYGPEAAPIPATSE
jgi:hypothetical protein